MICGSSTKVTTLQLRSPYNDRWLVSKKSYSQLYTQESTSRSLLWSYEELGIESTDKLLKITRNSFSKKLCQVTIVAFANHLGICPSLFRVHPVETGLKLHCLPVSRLIGTNTPELLDIPPVSGERLTASEREHGPFEIVDLCIANHYGVAMENHHF